MSALLLQLYRSMSGIKAMALTMIQFISLVFVPAYVALVQDSKGLFLTRIGNENCILILGCSFRQVPARNKGECALLTLTLRGSGCYHDPFSGTCNVCNSNSTFKELNSNRRYYARGRWVMWLVVWWRKLFGFMPSIWYSCNIRHPILSTAESYSVTYECSQRNKTIHLTSQ